MKYVLTEDGKGIQMKDGKPLVDPEDGSEPHVIDAVGAQDRITALNKDVKEHRIARKAAEDALEPFKAIEDPAAAIEALQTVSSMDEKHKVDMDSLKKTINETWQTKQQEWEDKNTSLADKVYKLEVLDKFATSDVLKKTILTPDIGAAYFSKHFKKDGTVVDSTGNQLFSKENPGEPAGFEEALGMLIDAYPRKKEILRGTGANGSGTPPSGSDGDKGHSDIKTPLNKISDGLKNRDA